MNRFNFRVKTAVLAATILIAVSCKKSNNNSSDNDPTGGYVVGFYQETDQGEGAYLLTANSLDTGTISTTGRGAELPGWPLIYKAGNNFICHAPWADGATPTYKIENGLPVKIKEALINVDGRVRATTSDNTALYISHAGELGHVNTYGIWHFSESGEVTTHKDVPSFHHPDAKNGSSPQGAIVSGNKLYVLSTGIYWDDLVWVADGKGLDVNVYSYPQFEYIGSSRDTRLGGNLSSGSYAPTMIADETGNIYTIACASKVAGFELPSTSGITRIKSGSNEFDATYFFDVEALGYKIFSGYYVGNNKIVAQVLPVAADAAGNQHESYALQEFRIAVLDLNAKTINVVSNVPKHYAAGSLPYLLKDGQIYTSIFNDTDGGYIYKVNPANATATRGAKLEGSGVAMYLGAY